MYFIFNVIHQNLNSSVKNFDVITTPHIFQLRYRHNDIQEERSG